MGRKGKACCLAWNVSHLRPSAFPGRETRPGKAEGGIRPPATEPIHFTERRSSTNGRQLGITIGQSRVNQNSECQQLVNRWFTDRSISELSAGSRLAVVEDNSFEFALQETTEVFSLSGKSILFPKLRLKTFVRGNFNYYSRPLKTCWEKSSSHFLKQETIFHGSLAAVVVDESHTVETWSGKSAINDLSELLL